MKCRLTRITENGHTRTKVVEGAADREPTAGHPFVMLAPALDPDYSFRLIETTAVEKILGRDGKQIRFKTLNTEYVFEQLDG